MSRIELRQTKAELRAAKRAVDSMRVANSFRELREAWQDFLNRIEKVWIKAELECQPVCHVFRPWQGRYKHMRRTDPLLTYIHHARNADCHTIQPVATVARDVRMRVAPGGTGFFDFYPKTGEIIVGGEVIEHAVGAPRYALVNFEDRGVCYNPPASHLGEALSTIDPLTVTTLGLQFYSNFVEEIERKFG